MGFRALLIQFHNQLRFSLFQVSTNTAVVIGQNDLVFVMAPNKARQLPQFLPKLLPRPIPGRSNYEVFMREMRRQGVELLNLTPLFTAWADTARYPLFPWSGTHRNAYGATLSADTILSRVEHLVHAPCPGCGKPARRASPPSPTRLMAT